MKKSLIALAVLATAGVASAQSSVTLFGIVDATLAVGNGSIADRTQLTNSGYNSSRLGFRGTEDLGGGMSASFWLEAGLNNDNGTGGSNNTNNQASGAVANGGGLNFNRRSTVSLAGGFGEIRLGRDYTPQFWNLTVFDPFGTNGVGSTQTLGSIITGQTAVRASNSIGYFLPGKLGGLYGQVQYYMGENASNATNATTAVNISDDGTGYGLRIGYAAGPLNIALATSKTTFRLADVNQSNLGAQYDFGMAKLMAHMSKDSAGNVDATGYLVGALIPVGAGEIRLAYSQHEAEAGAANPSSTKIAVGYVHNLSKRTALYTTFANVKNKGGAAAALNGSVTAPNSTSKGYDFGVRHSF